MRRFIRILTIAFICGILVVPTIEAQGHRSERGSQRTENLRSGRRQSATRPSNDRGSSNRGNRNDRPSNNRPGNNHNNRPDNKPTQRPGNNRHDRPSNRPPQRPDRHPTYGGHHTHRPPHMAPPPRPHRPNWRPYHRPVPPPSFRPYRGCPVIHGILGITFGSALHVSLDYLYNRGYVVDGYNNDVVYLSNVNELSFFWPDAVLYYGTNGLTGSRFSYSTSYYDRTRYNQIYSTFVSQYGAPINYQATNNGYIATWFGYDRGYVSLEFRPMYSSGGHLRYYTTLSFGL